MTESVDEPENVCLSPLTRQNVKRIVTAFAELAFTSTLNVYIQAAFFNNTPPCELSDLIFHLGISTLVHVILTLKGVFKTMYTKFGNALNIGQKLGVDNKMPGEAKGGLKIEMGG